MIKLQITAFIAVFFMAASLAIVPDPTPHERFDYSKVLMEMKQREADLEVKRIADAYARMSDDERLRGDAEVLR
jgi:hypothetical protein